MTDQPKPSEKMPKDRISKLLKDAKKILSNYEDCCAVGLNSKEPTLNISTVIEILEESVKMQKRVELLEAVIRKVDQHTIEYSGVSGNGDLYKIIKEALAASAKGG